VTDPAVRAPRGRPRTAGDHTCDRCGRATAKIRIRWPDGKICGTCFTTAAATYGPCDRCGQHRMTPGRLADQRLCRPCAGIPTNFDCSTCGEERELHRGGSCARCTLRRDLTDLLRPDAPGAPAALARLVDVLAGVDRPASIHTWKRNPAVAHLLASLGDRTMTFDHASFDTAPSGRAREHLRQLLTQERLLPRRDPDLAGFEDWLTAKLAPITDPAVLHPLEQFVRWHQLSRIRAKSAAGHDTQGPVHAAKQEITESLRFLEFLAQRQVTLSSCSQSDVDTWLASGPTTRHTVTTFVRWAVSNGHATGLRMVHRQARSSRLLSQQERLTWLRACLVEDVDTLPYRVAGVLLLLYAQPLVRVAALRTEHVSTTAQGLLMHFGGDPVPLPEPFAGLMRAHLANRPNMRTTNSAGSSWLFPGTRAGRHLHPNTLMTRLRRLGVDPLGARNAALRELVQQAPAPVVADLLGYSTQITLAHAARAAEPYNSYPGRRQISRAPR
jgi:hypothetical protein